MPHALLTTEDSRRIADALIDKIADADLDIAAAAKEAIRDMLIPQTANHWKADWFPLIVEDTCNKIKRGIVDAADRVAEQKRRKA